MSPLKLVLLSTATFGLYELWWCYQNWRVFTLRGEKLNPALRGTFANFTNFALFERLRRETASAATGITFQSTSWAAAYFVLMLLWRLPEPAGTLLGLLTCVPMIAANSVTTALNRKLTPDAPAVIPWTPLNVAGTIMGLMLWAFAFWAALAPEDFE